MYVLCRVTPINFNCDKCKIIYYCSKEHAKADYEHQEFCDVIQEIANKRGGHLYSGTSNLTYDEFRTYRVVTLNMCQAMLNNQITPYEKEAILFPKLCGANKCRECRNENLKNCDYCGEIAFCRSKLEHFNKSHFIWCNFYSLLKKIHIVQEKNGIIVPKFPTKILSENESKFSNPTMGKIFKALNLDIIEETSNSMLTLAASGPLTSWYALKLTTKLNQEELVIHIIGAEIEFELDLLNKWESFFLHLLPNLKHLTLQFVGPELNYKHQFSNNLVKLQLCKLCKKSNRTVTLQFEKMLYHEFCAEKSYTKPNLISFYNPGLHRSTGFQDMDTWPLTIKEAAKAFCPIVITSYTHYESPLDLKRFLNYSNRTINIIQPPSVNIFKSSKPERNFISDETVPLIFKNFYSFILQ
ncbi:uncharacterized protein LOC129613580 [Condylostylus longicornis]|uniref:uncharacterized protein LOC129613580 n=1 Tax=Condylostylus longicornis TaxID=2530218 RepID=UPI00244E4C54|nr:uncharacterized protein LOC129613580 [Condylostylus longicornis]